MHPAESAQCKGDADSQREAEAHAREALALSKFTSEEHADLFRHSLARVYRVPPWIATERIEAAGRAVLPEYYAEIGHLELGLEVPRALELASAKAWAIDALLEVWGSRAAVKRFEKQIANDKPRSICVAGALVFGRPPPRFDTFRRPEPGSLGTSIPMLDVQLQIWHDNTYYSHVIHQPYRGCLRLFADTTQEKRHPWRWTCDDCRARNGRTCEAEARVEARV